MTSLAANALPLMRPAVLARTLPFALYIAFLATGPLLAPHLPDPRWMYALQIGSAALALWALRHQLPELRWPHLPLAANHLAVSVIAGAVVFLAWINLDLPYLNTGDARGFDPRQSDGSLNMALVTLRILGAAVVVPVIEELFWRSFLLRWLEHRNFLFISPAVIGFRSLLVTSVIFGGEHNLWFAGIEAGLAYGMLYRHSKTLWSPILAHSVTNLLLGLWIVQTGNWQFW